MGRDAIARHRAALLAAADALDAILAPAQCPQLVQAIIQVRAGGQIGSCTWWWRVYSRSRCHGDVAVLVRGCNLRACCLPPPPALPHARAPLHKSLPCCYITTCFASQKYIMLSPDEVAEWEADPER